MMSPYLSDKSKSNDSIQLIEGDKFISDPKDVVEVFNEKYVSIADKIGCDSIYRKDISNHPSFNTIDTHMQSLGIGEVFNIQPTTIPEVTKVLSKLKPIDNKATS